MYEGVYSYDTRLKYKTQFDAGALNFYLNQDFKVTGREDLDQSGKPYPLFQMCYINPETSQNS